MELSKKHCVACEGKVNALSGKDEDEYLGNVTGWTVNRITVHKISKTVKTEKFMDAVNLLQDIAYIAEEEQHHPDLHLYYNKLQIELYTHKAGGLTENDFIMAAKIDDLLEKKGLLLE